MDRPKLPARVNPIEWVGPDHPLIHESGLIHFAHIPPAASLAKPVPLVVMVHGRQGDESVMWIFKQAIPPGVAVVAPRAPLAAADGFVWFTSQTGPLTPDPTALAAAQNRLETFIQGLPYLYPVDPQRLVLIGFSQGAAMVNNYALRHPAAVLAVASLAGAMVQPINGLSPAGSVAKLPVFIAHGLEDDTIPLRLARRTRDKYLELGAAVTYGEYPTGHKLTAQAIKDLKTWLATQFKAHDKERR
jgi:phospholipase/carboxylesterase